MATIKRDIAEYSDDETFSVIMTELSWLAGAWRETKDEAYAKKYQILLRALLEMGCKDELDFELLLPDELMPEEWHNRFKAKGFCCKDS